MFAPDLPSTVAQAIFSHIYTDVLESTEINIHHCSINHPCVKAIPLLSTFHTLRTTCHSWNKQYKRFIDSKSKEFFVPHKPSPNASRHKDGRNTQKKAWEMVVYKRYRAYDVLQAEHDRMVVFLAYDFGGVDGCIDCDTVVMKVFTDRYDDELAREEAAHLSFPRKRIPGLAFVHRTPARGYRSDRLHTIVMDRLGPTLQDLIKIMPRRVFDQKMVFAVAIQLIDRYRLLHSYKVLHNGAKAHNICLPPLLPEEERLKPTGDRPPPWTVLSLIDFGMSYKVPKHVYPEQHNYFEGNHNYLSVNALLGITQSQRDDLEALLYVLVWLSQGNLPWQRTPLRCPEYRSRHLHHHPDIWRRKAAMTSAELLEGMHPVFTKYYRDVRCLAHAEVPDYDAMKRRFETAWKECGYAEPPGELDWPQIYKQAFATSISKQNGRAI